MVLRPGLPAVLATTLLAVLAACDACGPGGEDGPPRCALPDGTPLSVGQSAPSGDGCNDCICTGAVELVCGTRVCNDAGPPQEDAGPEADAGTTEPDAGVVDEGPCPDEDDDGYHACIDPDHPERSPLVDCDDRRFHVQPNGIEFPETTEDDNCDGSNDDWSDCSCGVASSAVDLAGAMDVCGTYASGQTRTGGAVQFGIVDTYQGVIDGRIRARVDNPGDPPVIIGNDCLLTLGTGDATGTSLDVEPGGCFFNDPDPAGGNNFDTICDLATLTMVIDAPTNARGFAFDFMFLSHEWPEYLCLEFNDTFYAVVESDAVNNGARTNAAFDSQGRPITVNVGFFENPASWTVPLDGTPFSPDESDGCPTPDPGCNLPAYCRDGSMDIRRGSGSGWLTTTVPVVPGERDVRLTLTIHDESDGLLDSLAIVDGFRWLPFPTELGTAKEE